MTIDSTMEFPRWNLHDGAVVVSTVVAAAAGVAAVLGLLRQLVVHVQQGAVPEVVVQVQVQW